MQKLIKINEDHYIVVDDAEIEKGDFVYCSREGFEPILQQEVNPEGVNKDTCMLKITHSTQPLEGDDFTSWFDYIKPLSLSEVEEAINGYSVEKMAWDEIQKITQEKSEALSVLPYIGNGYIRGFNAYKELVKDKLLITDKDLFNFLYFAKTHSQYSDKAIVDEFIKSLLPKTEWEVTFDEQGKLKLI
jgi:hypothetical protein